MWRSRQECYHIASVHMGVHTQFRAKEHHFAPSHLQDLDDQTGHPKGPVPAPTASQPQQHKSECANVELTELIFLLKFT